MSFMFFNAESFNHPLNKWNISSIIYINSMFRGALSYIYCPLNKLVYLIKFK